jgi:hypothetical protein
MSRSSVVAFTVLGTLIGALGGWAIASGALPVGTVSRAAAQRAEAPSAAVAIAPGPGGMWVVHGDTLRVCMSGPLRAGYELFTPTCGAPVPLR